MTGITVTRWKRYGHDRAYATGTAEQKLGWIDLKTGEVTIEPGADAVAVEAALRGWASGAGATPDSTVPATTVPATTAPAPTSPAKAPATPSATASAVEPEWFDLAEHEPARLLKVKQAQAWEREKRIGKVTAVVARALDVDTEERAWRRGVEGEEVIGEALEKAKKYGWRVLHSVPTGDESDIDHVIIGPGGVVVVNSKCHKGAKVTVRKGGVYVNGNQTDHILQARSQVKRARKALASVLTPEVPVHGCIAIHNGGLSAPEIKFAHRFEDVWVASRWNIVNKLRREDPVLSEEQVDAIYAVARRSDTWI